MSEVLAVIPLKNTVIFPEIVVPLAVGRAKSLEAIKVSIANSQGIITVGQRSADLEDPTFEDLYSIGTLVKINRVEKREGGSQLIVQGQKRVRLLESLGEASFLSVSFEVLAPLELQEESKDHAEIVALLRENLDLARQIAKAYDSENGDQIYQQLIGSITDPVTQMYRIASLANLDIASEQKILEQNSLLELVDNVHKTLIHELQVTDLRRKIAAQAHDEIEGQQREHLLRQQKRAIEQALGEPEDDEDIAEIKNQLDSANLPEGIAVEVTRELNRLKRMSANAADYQVSRAYLELIAELPWNIYTKDTLDLKHASQVLDEDHFGLDEVKERILESLAVMQLNPDAKAPILCFVGPPGVGKTSLGQSIARAMERKFERLSLGGLHDEAELRGHRRTYIGAMPGRIIQAIRRAGAANPVLMLDEIDKLGRDFRGDPAAALMEVLDPAQNREFRDNYLNLPFDLSKVVFITTANTLEGIPRPLLDRMELLELSGYSDAEKQAIAQKYLIPRQIKEAGLTAEQLAFSEDGLMQIIHRFTREAGVRELERVIGRVARKRARQILEGITAQPNIDQAELSSLLGPDKYKTDRHRQTLSPGVAPGLAWTESGGDVLYVEASLTQKDDKITLTGHLGQVMQESARTAKSYIWSMAETLKLDRKKIENHGIHIHVPAGAVPKDGPSAGITMATALASAYADLSVSNDIAMTGEMTLTGLVLPVGGIKEKLLAAHRNGIHHIVIPKDNEAELAKLPDRVREELTITLVSTFEEAMQTVLPELYN